MKPKTCRICREKYTPTRSIQPTCGSFACLSEHGINLAVKSANKRRKAERAEIKKRKEKIKTRSEWLQEARAAFNAFIRARDQLAGYSCISSGRALDWSGNGVDAGHYRSVGSAPHLRFNEDNCHAQSKQDNRWGSGNAVDYRIGLIARLGLQRVEALEADNEPRKWTIDELKEIKTTYRAKRKSVLEKLASRV